MGGEKQQDVTTGGGAGSRWAEPNYARGRPAPCGRTLSWHSVEPPQGLGGPTATTARSDLEETMGREKEAATDSGGGRKRLAGAGGAGQAFQSRRIT